MSLYSWGNDPEESSLASLLPLTASDPVSGQVGMLNPGNQALLLASCVPTNPFVSLATGPLPCLRQQANWQRSPQAPCEPLSHLTEQVRAFPCELLRLLGAQEIKPSHIVHSRPFRMPEVKHHRPSPNVSLIPCHLLFGDVDPRTMPSRGFSTPSRRGPIPFGI